MGSGPCHGVPEQTPGHRVHASGWLIQEDDRGLSQQGNASAELALVATAEAEGVWGKAKLTVSVGSQVPAEDGAQGWQSPREEQGERARKAYLTEQEALKSRAHGVVLQPTESGTTACLHPRGPDWGPGHASSGEYLQGSPSHLALPGPCCHTPADHGTTSGSP